MSLYNSIDLTCIISLYITSDRGFITISKVPSISDSFIIPYHPVSVLTPVLPIPPTLTFIAGIIIFIVHVFCQQVVLRQRLGAREYGEEVVSPGDAILSDLHYRDSHRKLYVLTSTNVSHVLLMSSLYMLNIQKLKVQGWKEGKNH